MDAIETASAIGVVGAGTMGAGIAQLAASVGHPVVLFDAAEGAAEKGHARIADGLRTLVARGKMDPAASEALLRRIGVARDAGALADTALVVEAIVEDLEVKARLFADLEEVLSSEAILATNTSSLSVTALARRLKRPKRCVGMHFFNPAPVMKLVEVVSGLATAPEVAARVATTAAAWGKVAVHTKSTPGFIVNRIARPYYAEALRLYEEQVADPATLDALMTEAGGFRMGPFALMDLIGNDVNYAVNLSVFNAFYQDPRFRPSMTQLELVDAGRLGRKTGRGFFDYAEGRARPEPSTEPVSDLPPFEGFVVGEDTEIDNVAIVRTDGRTAAARAGEICKPVIVVDLVATGGGAKRLAFAASPDVSATVVSRFVATAAKQGLAATRLPDWPGLVVMRTVAMLANEGFEAVMQGVADEASVDAAMRFGVNYPKGPIDWAREVGLSIVLSVLDNIHAATRDPRYRASFALRRAAGQC